VIRITAGGSLYLVLTLLLGTAAINTGNNLLYLIVAVLLGLLLVSGVFGKRNLAAVTVILEPPPEVYAGVKFPLAVVLHNERRRLPAFLLQVATDGGTALFPFVPARATVRGHVDCTLPERGPHRLAPAVVSSVFPFNFFVRRKRARGGRELIVFPRPRRSGLASVPPGANARRGEAETGRTGDGGDIISLRAYLAGDPLKHIDWKASARTGSLKTREHEAAAAPPVVIELDKIALPLEARLSAAAFLILDLMRRRRPVGLKIGGRLHKPSLANGQKLRMLGELACYGKADHAPEG
jgi:uncharacterized protein (DUF58 family)